MTTASIHPGGTTLSAAPELGSHALRAMPHEGRVASLDGLRGVAILLVMVHHFSRCMSDTTPAWRFVHVIANAGWAGVDLFFVLSGFLITGILLDHKGQPHYFRNFYMRRVLRIFPLYFGTLTVVLLVGIFANLSSFGFDRAHFFSMQPWLWTFTSNILIARSNEWIVTAPPFELNHFWSLAVEEQFYLVWPVAVLLLARRQLFYTLFGLIAVSLALRIWLEKSANGGLANMVLTPFHFDSLAMGALVAVAIRHHAAQAVRAARLASALAALAILLGAIHQEGWNFRGRFVETGGILAMALLFGAVLILALAPGTRLQRLLSSRPLRIAGTYSYGLYVIHQLLLWVFFRYLDPAGVEKWTGSPLLATLWYFTAAGSITFGLAWLSYHYYERPFLKLKHYFAE